MLFTITGNLLTETTAKFAFPKEGETVRALGKSTFQVGGKGVNVAKSFFKISKTKPFAIIFPAGFSGKRAVDWLVKKDFCTTKAFQIDGETRIGLVCENIATCAQTTFLGEDVPVSAKTFEKALEFIKKKSNVGDFVAFCGSFPAWKDSYAKKLAKLCKKNKLRLCVDTYGAPLKAFAKENLFLLKINKSEFLQTFGEKNLSQKNVAKIFKNSGCDSLVITNSKNEIFVCNADRTEIFKAPKIECEVSATGCGDTLLASIIAELYAGKDFKSALKISIARASASAEVPETASWHEARAKKLLKQIS